MNTIRSKFLIAAASLALGGFTHIAIAQQTTERFIPIGESPGVSNESSYVGRIVAVDSTDRTVTVEDSAGERHTLEVTDETLIWLDRSSVAGRNENGTYADCEVGRRSEVSYTADNHSIAQWIKLEAN